MSEENERSRRAGDYVSGVMSAAERERAERDLVHDAVFREAVLRRAEDAQRLRVAATRPDAELNWNGIAAALSALPQMRAAPVRPVTMPDPRSAPMLLERKDPATLAAMVVAAFAIGLLVGRFSLQLF